LAAVVAGLLPAEWSTHAAPLAVLGVRHLTLADIADALAGIDRPALWWHELYAGLASAHLGGPERDALGALPVLLADGRLVTGPRGVLMPTGELPVEALRALDLRLVDPAAAHSLLLQLGAIEATPATVLDDPAVRAAVDASYDDDASAEFVDAVLALVAAAGVRPGALSWLADLALPGADGESYPAGELVFADGPLTGVVAADAPFGRIDPATVEHWGRDVLEAVGVLWTFGVVTDADVPVDGETADHALDGEDEWLGTVTRSVATPATVGELVGVRDLDLVDPARWAAALDVLASSSLRSAVVEPTMVTGIDGRRVAVPSYTAWWLSGHPVLDGRVPRQCATEGAGLGGLYDVISAATDAEFLRAIGVRTGLEEVVADADAVADLLARLADPQRIIDRTTLRRIDAALASAPAARDVTPPDAVRALRAGSLTVAAAADAVVVDAPDLLPLVGSKAVVPVSVDLATDLADVLDLPVASELGGFPVVSAGTVVDDYVVHDELLVRDLGGTEQPVPWRLWDGVLHVDAGDLAYGLGRGRAWRDGRWADRQRRTEELLRPGDAALFAAEADLDGPPP
jgi:hypothetical protein